MPVAEAISTGKKIVQAVGNLKRTDNVLIRQRDAILKMFRAAGFDNNIRGGPVYEAIKKNKMFDGDIPNQKIGGVGAYNPEFERLYRMVVDSFINIGREDLATDFQRTVPMYTTTSAPIDYIATLLKGAGDKMAVKAKEKDYSVLLPFKGVMQTALVGNGIAAPSNMADLTQVFYNTFVAKQGTAYEPLNFYEMSPSDAYHVDEAIVEAVLTYVKNLSDRKLSGEQLPKTQDKIASVGIKVQDELQKKAKQEVAKEIGGTIMGSPYIVMIIVLIIVVVFGLYFFGK